MSRRALCLLFLISLGLGACANDGVNRGTTADYAREFQGLEIRRIGQDNPNNREFQNRAISNALADLAAKGVNRDQIENITVSTQSGSSFSSSFLPSIGRTFNYDVWININGCEGSVVYRAGPTGGITTSTDKGGCLSGG